MNDATENARNRLAAAGREKDRTRRWTTTLVVAALVLCGLVLVVLLDYWLMLPLAPRWGALVALAGIVAGGVWKLVTLWRRPTALKEAALDVEAARPGLGCEVSTAAEYLSGDRRPLHEFEPELVAALQQRAAATVEQNRVAYSKRLRNPALAAGLGLLAVALILAAVPGAGTAFKRAVAPWSRASFTQILVQPGTVEIPIGQDLSITNTFTGRPVAAATFQWRPEGSRDWQSAPLASGDKGVFVHQLKAVHESFQYRVSGGDAVSEEFTVSAYVPPAVQRLHLGLQPPAYTKLPVIDPAAPDGSVLRGTDAKVRLTPNVPLSRARVRFTNDVVLELTAAPDGAWEGGFRVAKDMDYTFELVDAKGHRGLSPKHHYTALPDNPPKLDITDPGEDLRAGAKDKVPLRIQGGDDFGVAKLRVIYHRLGGPEQAIDVPFQSTTNHDFDVRAELPLEGLDLKEYEIVAYHAEATDNNTFDGPGVGKSPVYFIEITNIESQKGKQPKTKPKPGEKVNLLAVQKQIIADTVALAADASKERFDELAKREADAVEFGKLYQTALMTEQAPVAAQAEMNQAVKSMEEAAAALAKTNRITALPPEELALASLYKVLQHMPQLGKLPLKPQIAKEDDKPQPPAVKVVLDAIKKKKPPEEAAAPELAELLEEMKQLQQEQQELSSKVLDPRAPKNSDPADSDPSDTPPPPGSPASGSPQSSKAQAKNSQPPKGQQPPNTQAAQSKPGDPKPGESKPGESKPGEGKEGESKAGEAKAGEPKEPATDDKPESQLAQAKPQDGKKPGNQPGKGAGKQPSEQKPPGKGQGQGKGEEPADGQGEGKGDQPNDKPGLAGTGGKPGEPKPGEPKPGERKPGQGKPSDPKPADPTATEPTPPASDEQLAKLAPKQEELSKEAQEMAERLARLAGKGARVGQGISRHMSQAAQQLDRAAKALRQGNAQSASGAGDQGSAAMNSAIALLERALSGRPDLSDVASEEAPKQYEGAISDYFKRLSRAE